MAAVNEQVGIAEAAYYPSLTLSAGAGLASSSFRKSVYLGGSILVRGCHLVGNLV